MSGSLGTVYILVNVQIPVYTPREYERQHRSIASQLQAG